MITDLIINSGIQYVSIPINLTDAIVNKVKKSFFDKLIKETEEGDIYELKEVYYWEDREIFIAQDSINAEAFGRFGHLNPKEIRRDYVEIIEEENIYSIGAKEALKVCQEHWIPLPYFRIRQDVQQPFHHGPENWCRMNLQPKIDEDKNTTHILTLAFDTNTNDHDEYYSQPRETDANDNGSERFKCVPESKHAPSFFKNHNLWEWLYNIFWVDEDYAGRNERELKHVAIYHTLIKLLDEVEALPEIGLLSGENSIEVGMTLDIGNSRTCGLICEKSSPFRASPFDFTSARKLQIRNLSKPHIVYEEPFEMQVAFSEEKFGNPASEEYDDVFDWPSLVRVGPEAVDLTSLFESEDSQATLSSPKRYLWDKKPVKVPWIKVDTDGRLGYHDKVKIKENALYGIAPQITSDGKYIKESEKDHVMGATESRFSRSSIMMLSIYEILLHVVSQINNHEFRKDLGNSTYRRILKDVVITCPTAMTVQEQYALRKAVVDATKLLKQTIGEKVDFQKIKVEVHPSLPNLDPTRQDENPWKYDEATCSQIAFLYGELVHKYSANQHLFFDLNGKYRNNSTTKSINMASIDIGGGTTDFMICNYSFDKEADVPFITPKPIFWEGFNLAGDDIVKRIIEKLLIPTIHEDVEKKGGKNVVAVLNELFGQNLGGQTAKNKIYRKQFANLVGTSVAYMVFEHLTNPTKNSYSFTIKEVFERFGWPKSGLIDFINKNINRKTGVNTYNILELELLIDDKNMNDGIKDVMGDILNQLSYLISFFDCDIILLSGRPSRLPVITEIITSSLNFGMNKVVNLGNYRFGNWYPFADSTGYVDDPKSTVCVGSLIAYLNENGKLPSLRFDFAHMQKVASTANYFGVIDHSKSNLRIKDRDLLLSPNKSEDKFKFYGEPISIGMKQLESQDWTATPLYMFDYIDDNRKARMNRDYEFPYHIKIHKPVSEGEFLSKDNIEVQDNQGVPIDAYNFDFRLRTSSALRLHWKDSGSFITRIE
ncbi:hypothetical protein CAP47_07100 [Psychroflexus sp. S27]|uniref:virulence factor SrfB n=1 Tax=Psychroflexus sp. S27 TaxID=1982757 RepID=UPI000C29C0B2|nr:virulence factor SrfB [Psychroflexus sp. S27]PJX22786.1 hypothetical protein CAP47_07100 [Psychroflexus sp. S27]